MMIYSFDPGLATGVAWWDSQLTPVPRAKTVDEHGMHWMLEELLETNPELVVCESFTITSRTAELTQQHWSLEWIGALKHACWKLDRPFVLQSPVDAKTTVPNAVLRRLGWWVRGRPDHEHDALRHLALYRLNHRVQHEEVVQAMLHRVE